MHPLKCLIIDDEPLAQNVIENYLKNVAYIELMAKCDNALSALTWIKKHKRRAVKALNLKRFLANGISIAFRLQRSDIDLYKYSPKIMPQ